MAQAQSISLSHFTSAVQAAVKAAAQKHPKFSGVAAPQGITFNYLIRGIPVPESLLANVTFAETQAFANEIAAHVGAQSGVAALSAAGGGGAVYSVGRHIILGIPAAEDLALKQ